LAGVLAGQPGTVTVTVQVEVYAEQTGELETLTGAAGEDQVPDGHVPFLDADQVGTGLASVTGQTVVETGMTEVTTTVLWAGQLVTVGAQLVMV
jgi:hypothetical protein